jgi:hypothetical protein
MGFDYLIFFSFWQFQGLNSGLMHLLDRRSSTSATSPALFAVAILKTRSCFFCPGHPGLQPSYFMLPALTEMTDVLHYAQFFLVR